MSSSINKKEIKKDSGEFRKIANRVLNSDYDVFDTNLKRLIYFVEKNDLIMSFISSCMKTYNDFDIESDVKAVTTGYGEYIFGNFIEEEKEVSYTYKILKHIVDNDISYRSYAIPYSTSNKYQDKVKGFNEKFILPLVESINGNYERICIEMGYDEDSQYNITINGGQVILAKDNANVVANQSNYNQVNAIVDDIKNKIDTIKDEELKIDIIDNIEGIQEEIQNGKIKKGRMKSFVRTLQSLIPKVGTAIEVAAAITQLINFVEPFIK